MICHGAQWDHLVLAELLSKRSVWSIDSAFLLVYLFTLQFNTAVNAVNDCDNMPHMKRMHLSHCIG